MSEGDDEDIPERVAALESRVAELHEELSRLRREIAGGESESATVEDEDRPRSSPEPSGSASERSEQTQSAKPAADRGGPDWLNYVGIGLLLVGVGLLFQYAVDRGWLTESVRVGMGAGLGAVLLLAGFRLEVERPGLASVLRGGASATFYATIYAAFQLYGLIPYPVAYALMIGVTAGTFVLSIREDDVVLAQIGALGAYGTPFMLYTGDGGVPGLVAYTSIATAGIAAVYLYRGWRSLLATMFVGHWLVMGIGRIDIGSDVLVGSRVALQVGTFVGWALTGGVPVAARLFDRFARDNDSVGARRWIGATAVALTPLVVAGFSRTLWEFPGAVWSVAALVGVGGYAGLYRFFHNRGREELASVVPWVVAVGLAWGVFEVAEGPVGTLGLALETLLLVEGARRLREGSISAAATVVGGTTLLFIVGQSVFDHPAAMGSAVLGGSLAVVFAAVRRFESSATRLATHYAVHLVALSWIFGTFASLPNGQAWVSVLWAALGIGVTFAGATRHSSHARVVGLATVALVVAKLFVVDLAELEPLWRIVLFVGLGGGFLLVSYFVPGLIAIDADDAS